MTNEPLNFIIYTVQNHPEPRNASVDRKSLTSASCLEKKRRSYYTGQTFGLTSTNGSKTRPSSSATVSSAIGSSSVWNKYTQRHTSDKSCTRGSQENEKKQRERETPCSVSWIFFKVKTDCQISKKQVECTENLTRSGFALIIYRLCSICWLKCLSN